MLTCLSQTSRHLPGFLKEVAPWLRALAALPEDLGSVPGTHMVAHKHL